MKFKKYNREHTRRSKKLSKRFWCWVCDGCLISPGQKCPRCKHRDESLNDKGRYFEDLTLN